MSLGANLTADRQRVDLQTRNNGESTSRSVEADQGMRRTGRGRGRGRGRREVNVLIGRVAYKTRHATHNAMYLQVESHAIQLMLYNSHPGYPPKGDIRPSHLPSNVNSGLVPVTQLTGTVQFAYIYIDPTITFFPFPDAGNCLHAE